MALIRVNHSVLLETADDVKMYCEEQDRQMRSAKSAIETMLVSDWIGADAIEFKNKWGQVDTSGSVTITFRDSLTGFENALRACAKEYQTAQEDSYNEAYWLPR